ncbi:MAG: CAP domain-containing protein [Thermoleophilaceae bacterium]
MTVTNARASTLAVLVACTASLIATPAPSAIASTPSGATASSVAAGSRARQRINAFRARHGVRPLRSSRSLNRSATAYARFMLRRGYFGHQPRIRASRRFSMLGETLLLQPGGRARPAEAVHGWAGSPPHRAILLSAGFRQVGVGTASGRFRGGRKVTIWVAHVARR